MILGIKNKTVKNIYYQDFNTSAPLRGAKTPDEKKVETAGTAAYSDTLEIKKGLRITLDYDNYTSSRKEYKVHMTGDMEEVKFVGSYEILGEENFYPVKSINSKKFEFSYGSLKNKDAGFIINVKV